MTQWRRVTSSLRSPSVALRLCDGHIDKKARRRHILHATRIIFGVPRFLSHSPSTSIAPFRSALSAPRARPSPSISGRVRSPGPFQAYRLLPTLHALHPLRHYISKFAGVQLRCLVWRRVDRSSCPFGLCTVIGIYCAVKVLATCMSSNMYFLSRCMRACGVCCLIKLQQRGRILDAGNRER